MGITKFISKVCVQTAVYWGNPVEDGRGGKTFDDPVEIKCRWSDYMTLVKDDKGKEFKTQAKLLVTQDLDFGGYLYLGTLEDIEDYYESNGTTIDPREISGAYPILTIKKTPMIKSTTEFVRTVELAVKTR